MDTEREQINTDRIDRELDEEVINSADESGSSDDDEVDDDQEDEAETAE